MLAHRNYWTGDWKDQGQIDWIDSIGAHVYRGHGRLYGVRKVAVTSPEGEHHILSARHAVVVATGTRAVIPDLPGIAGARPWTSREATSAQAAPGRLLIVGGSVVAVEMATAWQALGSQVTVLARGDGLLPRMEPFAGELVADSLREAGAVVRTGVSVEAVVRDGSTGPVSVVLEGGETLEGDELLMATGRAPRTEDIGLDTVGLPAGRWIEVDDTCRVPGHDWLYAVGDVNHRVLLTHQGKYQARIAGAVIAARAAGTPLDTAPWGAHTPTADIRALPQAVFTDPEAAAVGLTLAEAERAGHRVRAVDYDMSKVSGAGLYADGYKGRARMVVDLDREVLLGVTFVGPGAAELIHAATIAVAGRFRSSACGTRCRRSRPSARSGCDCWRPTGGEGRPERASWTRPGCAAARRSRAVLRALPVVPSPSPHRPLPTTGSACAGTELTGRHGAGDGVK